MRRAYSADRGFNWYIARLGPGAGTYHGSAATIRTFVKMDQSLFWTI